MPAFSLNNSIANRLALGNGALLVVLILVTSGVFYFGTVGVQHRRQDHLHLQPTARYLWRAAAGGARAGNQQRTHRRH
jgi:hypothetical protein